jgi:sugar phosphate permease
MITSSQTLKKVLAFCLTFLGYASLHSLREGWSYSKKQLENEFDISSEYLGIVDASYLISYSFGMAALGSIIHRVSLKTYIIVGLVLASCSYMLFPIIYGLTSFYSPILMTILMCFNGFFQATGWPGMMGIFGNWFSKNKKGVLMGIWAMNANVGNIIASNLCNLLQNNGISWIYNFLLTGAFAFVVASLMFFFLK